MSGLLNQPWMARAGWTLLHFLWQGSLIALLFAVVRAVAGRSLTARARYLLACAALAAMTIAPLLTFFAADNVGSGVAIAARWQPSSSTLERALPWVVVIWLCGAIVFSLRLMGAWRFTKVLRTVAVVSPPPAWQRSLDNVIGRIGVTRPVQLLVSSLAEVPMVIGWLRPVVLMPAGALAGIPLNQVEALLAHELAHIWRNDYVVNILQSIAEAVLFYHPAVWWISGQIRMERELCCDDIAVAASGDVLVYVRALTGLETCRRARLNAALAADGGSLVSRVRRLIAEPRPVVKNLPAAGAAWVLSLLWLAAIGAATVHGAASPVKPLPTPPSIEAPAVKLVSALMFDPFFAPQVAPARARPAEPNRVRETEGMRANGIDLVYLSQLADAPREPLEFSGQAWILPPRAFSQSYESDLNSGSSISINAAGSAGSLSTTCPVSCAEFEAWVEGLSGDYAESISTELSVVERDGPKTTLQRFVGDDMRHVYVTYKVAMEILAETGTYRLTFADSAPAIPEWIRPPAGSKLISPPNYPASQIVRDGDTIALELFASGWTGQRLIDYIHVGQGKPILLRTETARDAYADNAEFLIAHPRLSINGVGQESLAGTIQGPLLWAYVPGHGRILLSFQPNPDLGFRDAGEVSGNSLTFSLGRDVFRIDGAERIASAGSGVYRVHVLQDAAWEPADPADRTHFMIGSAPAIETAGGANNKGALMRATTVRTGILALAMNTAFGQGQTGQTQTRFDVAAVRPEPPSGGPPVRGIRGGPGSDDPTRISYSYVTMQGLLVWAYGLPIDQISGPSWLTTERYSIDAKVPPGATREQLNVMLQNLLAERFKFTAHLVKKDFDAYELMVAKGGLKMKESAIDSTAPAAPAPAALLDRDAVLQAARTPLTFKEGFPVLAPGNTPALWGVNVNGRMLITARQQTMDSIATRTLQNALGAGARVVDKTGLTGKYDFHLQFARPNPNAAAAAQPLPEGADFFDSVSEPAPDIVTAAQQQLGLTLTKGKISMDVLVVDHADKVPTEN
jgi:uncharacterized protein (TIGR03435 family)